MDGNFGNGATPNTARYVPTQIELPYFEQLFHFVTAGKGNQITGQLAVPFFLKSKVAPAMLKELWNIADSDQKGFLTRGDFHAAMRLISMAQNGISLSSNSLMETSATHLSLPVFEGIPNPTVPAVPAQQGQSTGGTAGPASSSWAIDDETRGKYSNHFFMLDKEKKGHLTGPQAREFMMKSNLPQQILGKIWIMSDMDQDGKLTLEEFCVAFHLIVQVSRRGRVLPNELPEVLKPGTESENMANPEEVMGEEAGWGGEPQPEPMPSPGTKLANTLSNALGIDMSILKTEEPKTKAAPQPPALQPPAPSATILQPPVQMEPAPGSDSFGSSSDGFGNNNEGFGSTNDGFGSTNDAFGSTPNDAFGSTPNDAFAVMQINVPKPNNGATAAGTLSPISMEEPQIETKPAAIPQMAFIPQHPKLDVLSSGIDNEVNAQKNVVSAAGSVASAVSSNLHALVGNMERQVEQLETERNSLSLTLDNMTDDLVKAEETVKESASREDLLRKEILSLRESLEQRREELWGKKEEALLIKGKTQELDQAKARLANQIRQVTGEIQDFDDSSNTLMQLQGKHNENIQAAEKEIAALKETLRAAEIKRSDAKAKYHQSKTDLQAAAAIHESKLDEKHALKKRIAESSGSEATPLFQANAFGDTSDAFGANFGSDSPPRPNSNSSNEEESIPFGNVSPSSVNSANSSDEEDTMYDNSRTNLMNMTMGRVFKGGAPTEGVSIAEETNSEVDTTAGDPFAEVASEPQPAFSAFEDADSPRSGADSGPASVEEAPAATVDPFGSTMAFPSEDTAFPTGDAEAFPSEDTAFPSEDTAFPSEDTAFPSGDAAFPSEDAAFPSEDAAFPTGDAAFPTGDAAFPTGDAAFPTGNAAFRSEDANFPTGDTAFPEKDSSANVNAETGAGDEGGWGTMGGGDAFAAFGAEESKGGADNAPKDVDPFASVGGGFNDEFDAGDASAGGEDPFAAANAGFGSVDAFEANAAPGDDDKNSGDEDPFAAFGEF